VPAQTQSSHDLSSPLIYMRAAQVPHELTEGSSLGGLVSLLGMLVSAVLVYVHVCRFLTPHLRTEVQLERAQDTLILHVELTMERLPCRFSSIDLFDVTGTKLLNLSEGSGASITKQRVSSADGHPLADRENETWHDEEEVPERPPPTTLDEAVHSKELVFVLYGVPWCPHTKALQEVWTKLDEMSDDNHLEEIIALAHVDCVTSAAMCQSQMVTAYPSVRLYR
jgi:hypothetical protein